jgi:phage shock protein A
MRAVSSATAIEENRMPDEPQLPEPAQPDTGYDSSGVPTFDSVREKIENRYGTALGGTELAEESREGRDVEEQYEERQRAAAEKLAQIREAMRKGES